MSNYQTKTNPTQNNEPCKKTTIIVKVILCYILLSLVCLAILGCQLDKGKNPTKMDIVNIATVATIVMETDSIVLPEIQLEDNKGNNQVGDSEDFWYKSEWVYVSEGFVYVVQNAPTYFETTLEIIYKYDNSLKTNVEVSKVYYELKEITIKTSFANDNMLQDDSLELVIEYSPSNASDKTIVWEYDDTNIVIDSNNIVKSKSNAAFGIIQIIGSVTTKFGAIVINDIYLNIKDPILISSPNDLKQLETHPSEAYRLTNNLDLSQYSHQSMQSFSGILDGAGYVIANIFLLPMRDDYLPNYEYYGFFGRLDNARIKNLNLDTITANGGNYEQSEWIPAGALAGWAWECEIVNVTVQHFSADIKSNYSLVGGIVGLAITSAIKNSSAININFLSSGDIGGLVGNSDSIIQNCTVSFAILQYHLYRTNGAVGGIAGVNGRFGNLIDCVVDKVEIIYNGASGGISQTSIQPSIGYIVGNLYSANLTRAVVGDVVFTNIGNLINDGKHNQLYYCFNGKNGQYGQSHGGSIVIDE